MKIFLSIIISIVILASIVGIGYFVGTLVGVPVIGTNPIGIFIFTVMIGILITAAIIIVFSLVITGLLCLFSSVYEIVDRLF